MRVDAAFGAAVEVVMEAGGVVELDIIIDDDVVDVGAEDVEDMVEVELDEAVVDPVLTEAKEKVMTLPMVAAASVD